MANRVKPARPDHSHKCDSCSLEYSCNIASFRECRFVQDRGHYPTRCPECLADRKTSPWAPNSETESRVRAAGIKVIDALCPRCGRDMPFPRLVFQAYEMFHGEWCLCQTCLNCKKVYITREEKLDLESLRDQVLWESKIKEST